MMKNFRVISGNAALLYHDSKADSSPKNEQDLSSQKTTVLSPYFQTNIDGFWLA
jgi:hypothetical protein